MRDEKGQLPQEMLQLLCDEGWSNAACCGYALLACQSLGYADNEVREFLTALNHVFGNYSVECARKTYINAVL